MPRFGQLPEIFEYADPEFKALTYDHEQKSFSIGGKEHELGSPELYNNLLFPVGEPLPTDEITKVPVALTAFGNPFTTPQFFNWLTKPNASDHFQQTADVMRDTFSTLQSVQLNDSLHRRMSPFGFSCEFIREGHVTLSVLGNCACLGTNPDGHLIDYHDWDTGFAELDFHNIDMPTQHISLLAGLGNLASLCAAETE